MDYSFEMPEICPFFSIPTLELIFPKLLQSLLIYFPSILSLLSLYDPVINPISLLKQVVLCLLNSTHCIPLVYHTCLSLKAPGDRPHPTSLSYFPTWALFQEASLPTLSPMCTKFILSEFFAWDIDSPLETHNLKGHFSQSLSKSFSFKTWFILTFSNYFFLFPKLWLHLQFTEPSLKYLENIIWLIEFMW